jgi:WD40 repeat protein
VDDPEWRPLGQLLGATLAITALQFTTPDGGGGGGGGGRDMLLAASRDRFVSVYAAPPGTCAGEWGGAAGGWRLVARVKAHDRIIWDAAWALSVGGGGFRGGSGGGDSLFATGGRDKRVKLWTVSGGTSASFSDASATATGANETSSVTVSMSRELPVFGAAVTAVAFALRRWSGARLVLATGLEDGRILIWAGASPQSWAAVASVAPNDCHAAAIRAMSWQPQLSWGGGEGGKEDDEACDRMTLASCGGDHSVRLFGVLMR